MCASFYAHMHSHLIPLATSYHLIITSQPIKSMHVPWCSLKYQACQPPSSPGFPVKNTSNTCIFAAVACKSALGPDCSHDVRAKHSRKHWPSGGCKRPQWCTRPGDSRELHHPWCSWVATWFRGSALARDSWLNSCLVDICENKER